MNALHPPAHAELEQIFDVFAAAPDLWIAVVTGAGNRSFCAGTDLKARAESGTDAHPPTGFAGLTHRFDLNKPIIAAVNGLALGGGLEIVLATDIVVAAENAEFGFPEPHVGLAATSGGVHRLVRQIPQKLAMDLLLTGRRINAQQALEWGLINQVVPAKELRNTVNQWVAAMLKSAPLALQATKEIAYHNLDHPSLAAAIKASYPAVVKMLASRDAQEGVQAFTEKRPPRWEGL